MRANLRAVAFRAMALLGAVLVLAPGWLAHALQAPPPAPPPPPPGVASEVPPLAPQQLDDMVAPIALYPDPLVAQILAAATYPLEVVEADRWLQANPGLKGTALTDAARNQPWDPSVQALVVFPSVLAMLDRNLTWTVSLGNAFLAQPQDVMDAIQRQRQRALSSGALASNQQHLVQQGAGVIEIVPAQPEVIYVPVYDPVMIWGPPVFYPWPPFWYPPRPVDAVIAAGFFGFFFGVGIAQSFHYWGGWPVWGWGVGWHEHTVVVNNSFYTRNNYRLPSNYIRSGPSAWSHDPSHRGGLAYPSRSVAGRVGAPAGRISPPAPRLGGEGMVITRPPRSTLPPRGVEPRPAPGARSSPTPGVRSGPAPGVRSEPAPGVAAPQPPLTPPSRADRDRTLFGGSSSSGSRARVESDRGHSSLGTRPVPRAAPPQSRPAPTPQVRPAPAPQGRPAPAPPGRPAPSAPGRPAPGGSPSRR
jgi:hypothetical protein